MSFDENRILKVGRKIEHTYPYLEAFPFLFFKGDQAKCVCLGSHLNHHDFQVRYLC